MGLFGSAKSATFQGVEVTLTGAHDGATKLLVNGESYGIVRKGATRDKDSMLVNSELTEEQKAEAIVGLMSVLSGETPKETCKQIEQFRQFRQASQS